MKGVEGKIVDPQPQEDGGPAVGELAVRGAVVMKGYWNRPDATAAVFRDGWFLTGDLGYFDPKGHLFLTGRKKEVIVLSNGKNVYPEEIEAHYLKSPLIKEIAVMGIEGKPGEGGDRLHAVIVPNFDVIRQRKIVNAKEVIRFEVDGLSPKLPRPSASPATKSGRRSPAYHDPQNQALRSREEGKSESKAKKLTDDSDLPAEKPSRLTSPHGWSNREVQRGLKIIREASRTAPATLRPTLNLELDLGSALHAARRSAEPVGRRAWRECGRVATRRDLHGSRPARRRVAERSQRSRSGSPHYVCRVECNSQPRSRRPGCTRAEASECT